MARKPKPATRQCQLSELLQKHILFFGGKGGVGKTTAACATAFHLLDRSKGDQRIYLFSTDPAHSLADSIGGRVGRQPRVVARHRRASLYACELDPAPAFEEFKKQYGGVLAEVLERGTFLSQPEIGEFLGLSVPGIDEVIAFLHLSGIV